MNVCCDSWFRLVNVPPLIVGHNHKNKNTNVVKSKIVLIGPKNNINRPKVLPDQSLGLQYNSSSTLSHGRIKHKTSYNKFKSNNCIEVIGKNGSKTLAITTANILPKLEDAVIRIYLLIFTKTLRPSNIPSSKTFKSFFNNITSAASCNASVAPSADIPTSDWNIACKSFIPSPKNPTVCPFSCNTLIIFAFCFGDNCANIVIFSHNIANSSSVNSNKFSPSMILSVSKFSRLQTDTATLLLSPVKTLIGTFNFFNFSMASCALFLGASKNVRYPSNIKSFSSSGIICSLLVFL